MTTSRPTTPGQPAPEAFDEAAARARIAASPTFAASAQAWEAEVSALTPPLAPIAPPPAVWDRIADETLGPATLTVRAEDGEWEPLSPGVSRRVLHRDPAGGWQAVLIRMAPGATLAAHSHASLEECVVLEGEFEVDGETVRKGDFHLAFAGRDHPAIHSRGSALLYIRTGLAA
ncbi:cupin domain-containing protein [Phenylobacterium aquaticum]|uniref:cupin domain-containing protein n=1 Tax=Phenylobacterium aquaticum TaxID=1763816 RepID=UPI001F5CD9AA|nr:cupin domain-containing protein [Phenylobacterium aquaticum]MCI3131053.1 cupin domain-containing protein [Phenylobacterium aquaticum]